MNATDARDVWGAHLRYLDTHIPTNCGAVPPSAQKRFFSKINVKSLKVERLTHAVIGVLGSVLQIVHASVV